MVVVSDSMANDENMAMFSALPDLLADGKVDSVLKIIEHVKHAKLFLKKS